MTINTKYARLLSATKHYIFLLLLASLFLLASCGGGGESNPPASALQSNLSIADATALESAGAIEFTVSLSATSDSATFFDYRTKDGSASSPSDYLAVATSDTIAAGASTTTISITIINDKEIEEAESFIVEILQPSSNSLLDTATATIEDDDDLPSLSIADATALESAGAIEFTVSLSATSDSATSFDYRTQDGSASSPSDYTSVTKKTASITAGASTTTISITIINDKEIEEAESFIVEILQPSSNSLLDTATATIENDDLPSLSITGATALEGAGSIKFTVSLSESFPGNIVSFDYTTIAGSASAGADYTSVVAGRATIDIGKLTTSIMIDIINDDIVEDAEIFIVEISNPSNATIDKNRARATATIENDDLPSLFIVDATAKEGAGSIEFTVSLSEAFPGKAVSFYYETIEIAGGASAGTDYTSDTGRATIDIGKTTTSIMIDIINDDIVEDAETFMVEISNPINATIDKNRARATATIEDDDLPSLFIVDATAKEGAGSIEFTVSLSEAFPGKAVSFYYETIEIAGGASAGTDYTSDTGRATIDIGKTTTSIMIDIINDDIVEDAEIFLVEISNPINATIDKNRARATATIENDDLPSLSIVDATAKEGAGSIEFTVSLSEAFPGKAVSFYYETIEIAGGASAGTDYTSDTGRATIDIGKTTTSIMIDIINDDIVEDAETFMVEISNPINATIDKNRARATATIEDNDLPSLSIADATAFEGAGSIEFTVSLSEAFPGKAVSFYYETIEIAGGASAGTDYTSDTGRATIDIGKLTTSIMIDIINDDIVEDAEIFIVEISNPSNATIDKNRARATATIEDDDLPSLFIVDATAKEGAGSIEFTVSLSEAFPGKAVSFYYETIEIAGGASAGTDYTSDTGRATIDIGKLTTSIMIDIINDDIVEDAEIFIVEISNPSNATIDKNRARATATIENDDLPSLFIVDATAKEGAGSIEFTVSLSEAFPGKAVSFYYETIEIAGGASAGTDYTSDTGRATIDIGKLTTSIMIDIINDDIVEDAEIFIVEISNPSNATIDKNRARATATIENDDLPSLSITGATALEGAGSIKFTVSLSESFPGNIVSFDYATIAGSAIADLDYTSTSDTTSIQAGDTTAEIIIAIISDTSVEYDETFELVISNPQPNIPITIARATATIKNDDLPSLSITNATALESDSSIKFTVSLSESFPGNKDVVFNYATIAGSASAGADYTSVVAGRATIDSGKLTTSIMIDIINDDIVEDAETFLVEISNPINATIDISQATGTIKISDLNLAIADATTLEGAGQIEFIVSLSALFPGSKDVVFNYETRATTNPRVANAIAGADYTSKAGRATIDSGKLTTSIMIEINDDNLVEDIETFLVEISPTQLDIPSIKLQATGTIKIDDLPSLSIANSSAKENAGILTFRARLSEPFPGNLVSFDYQTQSGSANNKIVWQQATEQADWSARERHSSVVFNGKIWVLGGDDGSRQNDVYYSSDGSNWNTATTAAAWSARRGHSSVVFDDKIWVLGGNDGNRQNDVYYSSDGSNWNTATTDAAWSARAGHSSVVFKKKMWVMGGSKKNDVYYSSDGSNWNTATTDAAWSRRSNHSSVVFDNKIWLLGGNESKGDNNNPPGGRKNDVWYSTDGINWNTATTDAAWTPRHRHSSVVFDGKIWVLGGLDSDTNNNVWYSSNGADWSELPAESSWAARRSHSSVVFGNKIWVLGGYQDVRSADDILFNDVYFADATGDYFSASGSSSIPGGERSTTIDITLLDDDILELADETFDIIISNPVNATINTAAGDNQATGTIADIAIWTRATNTASWNYRSEHTSVVTMFEGENLMWVIGGRRSDTASGNGYYSADGISWTEKTGGLFTARWGHSSVVYSFGSYENRILVLGGKNTTKVSDFFFRSIPENPTEGGWGINNLITPWQRYALSSVVFKGKNWLLGGNDNSKNFNDVWSSSFAGGNLSWVRVKDDNDTGWSARSEHTSVVFNGKIWVLGGYDGSNKNDVWSSSDGTNWTMDNEHAAWSARSEHTSVVFNGKIWVLGGSDGSDKNDVWYSTDGKNWGEVTTSTTWSARRQHTSVVFDGKIWVLGGNDGNDKRDVWHLSE